MSSDNEQARSDVWVNSSAELIDAGLSSASRPGSAGARAVRSISELAQVISAGGARSAALVVDQALHRAEVTRQVQRHLHRAGVGTTVSSVRVHGAMSLAEVSRLALTLGSQETVVALGGGTVLDGTRLAATMAADPSCRSLLLEGSLPAHTTLRSAQRRSSTVIAVPTTLGTGSEHSMNVVVSTPDGPVLISDPTLVADHYVIDACATQDLDARLIALQLWEVLTRVMCPYIGETTCSPSQEAATGSLVRLLTRLAGVVRHAAHDGTQVTAAARTTIAHVSAASHTAVLRVGRDPFSFRSWYIATELAWLTGMSKAEALALVIPSWWHVVATSRHSVLGDPGRLSNAWTWLREELEEEFSPDPAAGLRQVLRTWGATPDRSLDAGLVDLLMERLVRRWGSPLPHLPGHTHAEIRRVLEHALVDR